MSQPATTKANFSLGQARHIVKDLFAPSPAIYWTDFLLSLGVGGACFALVRRVPMFSPQQILLFVASGILYYRAALFIHELIHLRDDGFKVFRFTWNLLCGIPFLIPSFLYYTHVDHHLRRKFGTHDDGEYLALGTTPPWQILTYLGQPLVLPILAILRFLVLAPLSWISPRLRAFVHQRASSMIMDPSYSRPLPSKESLRIFRVQEVCCFLFVLGATVLVLRGRLPAAFLVQIYLTSVFVLYLNHVRTLVAHRYTNAGDEMSFVGQLLDSVNYPNRPLLSEMWAPVGLRFHALHHLFPSLPYHNLPEAHRRLMAELPADSPYRLTASPSLVASLRELWRTSRAISSAPHTEHVERVEVPRTERIDTAPRMLLTDAQQAAQPMAQ